MKIGNFLREKVLVGTKKRLDTLIAISAPQIMLKSVKKQIRDLESGKDLKIKGDVKYLKYDFVSELWKTGRGGKKYAEFTLKNGEKVNYFPNAKYGRYIKKSRKFESVK